MLALIVLVAVITWCITKKKFGVLQWLAICHVPALVSFLLLISGFWGGDIGPLIGLGYTVYSAIFGLIVFVLGLAGYALWRMNEDET
jgi:hypothetical protein